MAASPGDDTSAQVSAIGEVSGGGSTQESRVKTLHL